jgi:hypothetical protein
LREVFLAQTSREGAKHAKKIRQELGFTEQVEDFS